MLAQDGSVPGAVVLDAGSRGRRASLSQRPSSWRPADEAPRVRSRPDGTGRTEEELHAQQVVDHKGEQLLNQV
ncbi:hypothetical protein GCM10018781_60510 [Kitasatospora indigofera]|uniref:Uncharacterized protein n=1 Tax=Kitasatospora indigofera TaxID=67307 RepID=A0A919G993_9ACTN|nr:hypothetical protein GCM10018781_60510 [Kitasatospora indigofera]